MRFRSTIPFILVIIPFLVIGYMYVMEVPLWETPDEPSTFSAAHAVAKVYRVPTLNEQPLYPGVLLNAKRYPPLYFVLTGVMLRLGPEVVPEIRANAWAPVSPEVALYYHGEGVKGDSFPGSGYLRLIRMVSILMGIVTLIFVWRTARVLDSSATLIPYIAVTVFGLTPTFISSHASIDPLPLGILFSSIIMYQILSLWKGDDSDSMLPWRLLAITLFLGFITRMTLVMYYLPVFWLVLRKKNTNRLKLMMQMVFPLLLGCTWALILAPGAMLMSFRQLGSLLAKIDPVYLSFGGLRTIIVHAKNSFWARFGWANIYAPAYIIDIFDVIAILALIGFGIRIVRNRTIRDILLPLVVLGIGFFGFIKGNMWQLDPQGRFIQLVIGAYAPLGALGLAAIVPYKSKKTVTVIFGGLLLVVMIGTNIYALKEIIRPAYAFRRPDNISIGVYQERSDFVWGGESAGQSFICRQPGLSGVDVYVTPARLNEGKILEFKLMQSPLVDDPIAIARVPYPGPGDNPYVGFDFEPIRDSAGRNYYVEVTRIPHMAPLGVWYTLEDRYLGGGRYADRIPAQGDLRFTTYITNLPVPD